MLQLGNYLGALSNWVSIQNSARPDDVLAFSIVDLHALTVESRDPRSLEEDTLGMAAALLAVGIDPSRSILFCQSHVGVFCWML